MPTWTIEKEFRFEAAHRLPQHDGKCRRLHGHSWVGRVIVENDSLIQSGAKQGMVLDYYDIGQAVKPLVEDYLDHHYLNETTGLANPSCEELARWIFDRLKPLLPNMLLKAVVIEETCTSRCRYEE